MFVSLSPESQTYTGNFTRIRIRDQAQEERISYEPIWQDRAFSVFSSIDGGSYWGYPAFPTLLVIQARGD